SAISSALAPRPPSVIPFAFDRAARSLPVAGRPWAGNPSVSLRSIREIPSTRSARRLRGVRRIALVTIVLVAVAAAVLGLARGRADSAEKAPPAAAAPPGRRESADIVKATGVIKPMIGAEVRVGSRVSGVVRRLYVRVGDTVAAGALLAELDDRDLLARRDEARAALELAKANAGYARADLRRNEELHAEALLAASGLDLARRAYAVAEQQV